MSDPDSESRSGQQYAYDRGDPQAEALRNAEGGKNRKGTEHDKRERKYRNWRLCHQREEKGGNAGDCAANSCDTVPKRRSSAGARRRLSRWCGRGSGAHPRMLIEFNPECADTIE